MKTLEQFSADILQRWNELHTQVKAASSADRTSMMKNPMFDPLLRYSGGSIDQMKLIHDTANKKLRSPIVWVGNLAVGESKDYFGWWEVIVPNSPVTISFFGPLARLRAIEKAEQLLREGR